MQGLLSSCLDCRSAFLLWPSPSCQELVHQAAQAASRLICNGMICGVAVLFRLPACRQALLQQDRAGGAEMVLQQLKHQVGTAVESSYSICGSLLRQCCAMHHARATLALIKYRWAVLWRPPAARMQLHCKPNRAADYVMQETG